MLHDITFTIKAGQMVGIVGPTGSGKSTIASLIPRFRDPDAGTITIDGTDIRHYDLRKLRSQIGFVLQDTVLLRGTIRDNIASRPDPTDDDIIAAAKAANAHEFIMAMPDGYHSPVGDRGMTLSGGQRQRIGHQTVQPTGAARTRRRLRLVAPSAIRQGRHEPPPYREPGDSPPATNINCQ